MTVENTDATEIDAQRQVGELVAERPERARLFERLGIDYCCGGAQSLAEACAQADAQLETVKVAIQALDEVATPSGDGDATDWRAADATRLCDHIVSTHHAFLRRSFPRTGELMDTVVRVHGQIDPALSEVREAFERVRSAMEPHLGTEEEELFPAIVAAEQGGPSVPEAALTEHEREHAEVGIALGEMRALCHGYDRELAHCNTHRALLDALEELEHDLHQHVHEENNILFRRARTASLAA